MVELRVSVEKIPEWEALMSGEGFSAHMPIEWSRLSTVLRP